MECDNAYTCYNLLKSIEPFRFFCYFLRLYFLNSIRSKLNKMNWNWKILPPMERREQTDKKSPHNKIVLFNWEWCFEMRKTHWKSHSKSIFIPFDWQHSFFHIFIVFSSGVFNLFALHSPRAVNFHFGRININVSKIQLENCDRTATRDTKRDRSPDAWVLDVCTAFLSILLKNYTNEKRTLNGRWLKNRNSLLSAYG